MTLGTLKLLAPTLADQCHGITSVCSAHPMVLRAALRQGRATGAPVLIEATCNQVNQHGGYTGMTPADFATFVYELAAQENCPVDQIILGGDHLGPNPWRDQPAQSAMEQAETMVAAYVAAGFRKLHLDTSMGCAGEPEALEDATTAQRAARLAAVAEDTAHSLGMPAPYYIIGTEVPPPGGADHDLDAITPTAASAAEKTIAVHRKTFENAQLGDAFARVLAMVVQPGVEFGNHNVIFYDRPKAKTLLTVLKQNPDLVFEAHSTDYQGVACLSHLAADGFSILKVGPELTFILREALYALDLIATDLLPDYGDRPLFHTMEKLMLENPSHWSRHYTGSDAEIQMLRHYSLSDRIRYYWPQKAAQAAVNHLIQALQGQSIPLPLLWQHLPMAVDFANTPLNPDELLIWRLTECLNTYSAACSGKPD